MDIDLIWYILPSVKTKISGSVSYLSECKDSDKETTARLRRENKTAKSEKDTRHLKIQRKFWKNIVWIFCKQ